MTDTVQYSVADGIARIHLNRPKASNALERIEGGYIRLSPVGDDLVRSLALYALEELKAVGQQIAEMAQSEILRRENA